VESRSLKSGVPAEIERAAKTHDKEKREKKKTTQQVKRAKILSAEKKTKSKSMA